jgi:hypothetical protein
MQVKVGLGSQKPGRPIISLAASTTPVLYLKPVKPKLDNHH